MTRSDIGVILIIYATCILFLYMTLQLKAAAQVYPLCLISGLAILDSLYLLRCLYKMYKNRPESCCLKVINDLPEIFKGFQARQFLFVVAAGIAYMGILYYLGFYLAGGIFLVGVMVYLQVRPVQICMTTALLGLLIYGVFTMFLKVPLPRGVLFS